jgi:LytR cell envelope-related transcriptional attenuator
VTSTSAGSGFGGRPRPREGGRVNSAVRGAGLIGLAVILGIVLLQVIDKGPSGGGTSASERPTPTTQPGGTTQPGATTAPSQPGTTQGGQGAARQRSDVRVAVYNAGQASGAAGNMTNKLRILGYQLAPAADSAARTGSVVACKQGYDKEAAQLQGDVGAGAAVEQFPAQPPSGTENVNCIVLLGR